MVGAKRRNFFTHRHILVEIADNMLRYGRVLNPTEEDARIVNVLNDRIQSDPRVENVLLPFRDGIMLAYKL